LSEDALTTDSPPSSSPPTANIFLRPGDQARLDRLVRAVSEEASSVALVSDSDAVLDHYGRMLAEELRSTAKVAVEIYSPDSTDALMDRFNRILASMSVSEALKAQGSTAPARLLLVYDGRATGVREMQLLARLLKDFPGANTRVALLLHAHAEAGKKIDAFGKRMVRWDVQRPSPEEAQALLTTATAQGQGQEAQALLAYLGDQDEASRTMQETLRVLARADEALATPPPVAPVTPNPSAASQAAAASTLAALTARNARPEPAFQEPVAAESSMQVDPALAAAALAAARPKKRMPTILLVALVALAASAALTFWQRLPDDTASKAKAPPVVATGETSGAQTSASAAADAAPAPGTPGAPGASGAAGVISPAPTPQPAIPTGPLASVTTSPPASPSPSSAPAPAAPTKGLVGPVPVPEDSDPAARLAAKVAPAAAPSPAPAPSPKSVAASTPPAKSPASSPAAAAPATSAPVAAPAPAAAAGGRAATANSPAEITSIPAGFYVQHMSSGEREVVEGFWRRNPSLRQARLVELTRIGAEGPNFVLLSGPFATINQARAFMNRPGLPKDMWVREASKIRPLLPPSR
jgi:hypothetical protein